MEATIRQTIEGMPPVRRLIHLRTQHLGPDELLVGAKIELGADLEVAGVATAINETEKLLRQAVPAARIIYLEPDIVA